MVTYFSSSTMCFCQDETCFDKTREIVLTQYHPFHLVDPSPWPFAAGCASLNLGTGAAMYLHNYANGWPMLKVGVFGLIYVLFLWWRDVIREAAFEGRHTLKVQVGLRIGMVLFIVSEAMFFYGFFWAFFSSALSPAISIGGVWPPQGIRTIGPWGIPFLNTLFLLASGASVTWSHYALIAGHRLESIFGMIVTLFYAVLFTRLQYYEYVTAPFSISDGIYGSLFYMMTGFHGFHVIIGTIFLFVCLIRLDRGHFSRSRHFGLEAAIWYWHFVDVVWILLYITIYWWGS